MSIAASSPSPALSEDARFMALALTLGRRGLGNTWPNPAVGAIVVRDDGSGPVIVGRGWTQAGGRPHAETEALRRAGPQARGATLYVTLEPCSHHGKTPPCVDAIMAAGIVRVVSAMEDPNPEVAGRGHTVLRAGGVAVDVGIGAGEACRAHAGHIRRMRDGRPHVLLKLAMTSDGKVGLAGRKPVAITGRRATEYVHRLRSLSDGILVGIGTALSDDPALTCRLPGLVQRSPVRIVLDSALRLPLGSRLAASAQEVPVWVLAAERADPRREQALRALGVEVLRAPADAAGRIDLGAALKLLGSRGLTRLMVEGGPIVAAAFVAGDLVDEVALFCSPHLLGGGAISALENMPLKALVGSPRLLHRGSEPVGIDRLDLYERA
jgi:diaminohydroxyphosphoribosylaminopyrimidine deaminase/5-amino-6-(5-phosphoribosylamino)uracil reductase